MQSCPRDIRLVTLKRWYGGARSQPRSVQIPDPMCPSLLISSFHGISFVYDVTYGMSPTAVSHFVGEICLSQLATSPAYLNPLGPRILAVETVPSTSLLRTASCRCLPLAPMACSTAPKSWMAVGWFSVNLTPWRHQSCWFCIARPMPGWEPTFTPTISCCLSYAPSTSLSPSHAN